MGMSRKKLTGIVITVFLICLVVIIPFVKHRLATHQIQGIPVEAATVIKGSIQEDVSALGSLSAINHVVVSAATAQHITGVYFSEGQLVQQGDKLFQLDDATTKAQVQLAEAALALSQTTFDRTKRLMNSGAVSHEEYDQAAADLKSKQASLAIAQAAQNQTIVTAPITGVVGAVMKGASVGNFVTAGQPLTTLVGLKELQVDFSVPQEYLSRLALGQNVHIKIKGLKGQEFSGKVSYISSIISEDTRMIQEKAAISNGTDQQIGPLRPGFYVQVKQDLGVLPNVLLLPQESLVASITGQSVYKIIAPNPEEPEVLRTILIPVTVLHRSDEMVEVKAGDDLHEGDRVVTAGQQKLKGVTDLKDLKEGSLVRVVGS